MTDQTIIVLFSLSVITFLVFVYKFFENKKIKDKQYVKTPPATT